jgi:hypothetical protein
VYLKSHCDTMLRDDPGYGGKRSSKNAMNKSQPPSSLALVRSDLGYRGQLFLCWDSLLMRDSSTRHFRAFTPAD